MIELAFPIAAVVVTFGLVVPLLTLLSRTALWRLRQRTTRWADFGSDGTFAWLVVPTLVPIVWLTSSAFHQKRAVAPRRGLSDRPRPEYDLLRRGRIARSDGYRRRRCDWVSGMERAGPPPHRPAR